MAPAVVLVAAVLVVYAGVVRAGFVWDDNLHVTANPTIIGPLGLREIWTTAAANYFPLVLTNFWIQHALWGLAPLGYHLVTVGCHALAAVLLWRVLERLRVPGAWLGAALWALHPLQVESVAWISELKNTQSAVFFLLSILCFVRWLDRGAPGAVGGSAPPLDREYALALAMAVLALMSKPSAVMLPAVLALIVWWRTRSIGWRDGLRLAPFFLLSGLVAGWTIWEQKFHSGAVGPEWSQTLPERLVIAGRVVWFYLGKLVWPHPLMFIYPRWRIEAADPLAWVPLAAVVSLLAVLWWRREQAARAMLWAALSYGALLFPVLGFFDVYFFRYAFVGDHFQYLAGMAPLALIAAGLAQLPSRAVRVLTVALPATCAVLTAAYVPAFTSAESLWRDTLARNPGCAMAWFNLADVLARDARLDESVAAYREALRLRPDDPDGLNDFGCVLLLQGRAAEAESPLARSVQLRPGFAEGHNNLGNVRRALGRRPEALADYASALQLRPDYAEAHNNLGAELAEAGRLEEALPHLASAHRLNPADRLARDNLVRVHRDLGIALSAAGRTVEALENFTAAVRLAPEVGASHANLGTALAALGRWADAIPACERAVQLAPDEANAWAQLGVARVNADRIPDAVPAFEHALRLKPDSAPWHRQFGQVLQALGRETEAASEFAAAARAESGRSPGAP